MHDGSDHQVTEASNVLYQLSVGRYIQVIGRKRLILSVDLTRRTI